MPLSAGKKLDPCNILAPTGAGGMGGVGKARGQEAPAHCCDQAPEVAAERAIRSWRDWGAELSEYLPSLCWAELSGELVEGMPLKRLNG
jgi:hypothetical protein